MEATISTVGNPQSMADNIEVVVTLTGQEGRFGECDTLKVEVDHLKWETSLILARDTISEVVVVVYDNIEVEHDGHSISNYGDVYALPKLLRSLKKIYQV